MRARRLSIGQAGGSMLFWQAEMGARSPAAPELPEIPAFRLRSLS